MKMLLMAFSVLGMLVGTVVAQDIPPVKELQVIPTWERSDVCALANAEFEAGRTVPLRYQNEKKKATELSVPAQRIHKGATETVRKAMRTQSQWAWVPSCLFVLHPRLDFAVPLPAGTSFLFTALSQENGSRAEQKQKPPVTTPDTGLDAAIAECRKEWPTDFVMQEYCIKRQTDAYRRLRGGGQ
jgi:hypothetical protein